MDKKRIALIPAIVFALAPSVCLGESAADVADSTPLEQSAPQTPASGVEHVRHIRAHKKPSPEADLKTQEESSAAAKDAATAARGASSKAGTQAAKSAKPAKPLAQAKPAKKKTDAGLKSAGKNRAPSETTRSAPGGFLEDLFGND